jgi:hypothetical protein
MLVGDPGDVLVDCAGREGHVVRDGDRDPRVRVDGRGGGGGEVLDDIDERGGGDGVWKQEGREADGEGTKERRRREDRDALTLHDEAHDRFTRETHEPRHEDSSRNVEDHVAGLPRSDPRHF